VLKLDAEPVTPIGQNTAVISFSSSWLVSFSAAS